MADSLHEAMMREAIAEAPAGAAQGNSAVGSVVVRDGRIVARGYNEVISGVDPTAHAEIVAIRRTAAALGTPVLSGATLYTTLEPCRCARRPSPGRGKDRVVIGSLLPPRGGVRSQARVLELMGSLIHKVDVVAEVLPAECLALLPADQR